MPTLAEIGAGVGGFAKRARDAISPWNMFSATDVASFLPGGGMVQASQEQFPAALKAYRAGDYGTAAREGLAGTLGTLGDVAWAAGPVIGATAGTALKAGSKAAAPGKVANTLADLGNPGIRVYHGSPHNWAAERLVRSPTGETQYLVGAPDKLPVIPPGYEVVQDFPLGRVRMDKIGTGEGAQAYGHGFYGAENEKVGIGYRDALAKENKDKTGGKMYELRINADPEHFLDWDKPLAQQSKAVQAALKQKYPQYFEERVINPFSRMPVEFKPGDDVQKMRDFLVNDQKYPVENSANTMTAATFAKRQNFDPAAMSQELNQAGIPGIKYLDAGSRGAGDGSRNYVVFDDKLVEILRKYGWVPGAAIPTAAMYEYQKAQQQPQQAAGPQM